MYQSQQFSGKLKEQQSKGFFWVWYSSFQNYRSQNTSFDKKLVSLYMQVSARKQDFRNSQPFSIFQMKATKNNKDKNGQSHNAKSNSFKIKDFEFWLRFLSMWLLNSVKTTQSAFSIVEGMENSQIYDHFCNIVFFSCCHVSIEPISNGNSTMKEVTCFLHMWKKRSLSNKCVIIFKGCL